MKNAFLILLISTLLIAQPAHATAGHVIKKGTMAANLLGWRLTCIINMLVDGGR